MVSHKIRRKRKHSRRTHKEKRNNTKKRYRRKNKTRKNRLKHKMKGGGILSWTLVNGVPQQFKYTYSDGRRYNPAQHSVLDSDEWGSYLWERNYNPNQHSTSLEVDDDLFNFKVGLANTWGTERKIDNAPVGQSSSSSSSSSTSSTSTPANAGAPLPGYRTPTSDRERDDLEMDPDDSPNPAFTLRSGDQLITEDDKLKTVLDYTDPNFSAGIVVEAHNNKKTIVITDRHRIWDSDEQSVSDEDKRLHRNLMVMLNLIDIVHDVIASGDLSYHQETSFENLIIGYSKLYNFDPQKAYQIMCQALYFSEDSDFMEILAGEKTNGKNTIQLFGRPMGVDTPSYPFSEKLWKSYLENEIENKANSCRTTGHKIEEHFKGYFVHCIPNKFLLNPREVNGEIMAEILNEWENLKTAGQVLSYGGGSIKGYEFWRYVIGRGNSILNKIHGLYDSENVNIPTENDDLLLKGLLKYVDYEKTKDFIDKVNKTLKDDEKISLPSMDDITDTFIVGSSENDLEKLNFLIKIITEQITYGTMNTIFHHWTLWDMDIAPIVFTRDIMQNIEYYRLYYFYRSWTSKYSTERQKQLITTKYESQYINRYDKERGIIKKSTQFTSLVNHPIQCNFTDAVGKAASALHVAWEKIKNASDNYALTSGAIIEQVNIASLIDEASTKLGKKGTISQFEDNRQPIRKKNSGIKSGLYKKEDLVKDFEKALLYPVKLTQPLSEDGSKEFEVYQEPILPSDYEKKLNFFNLYDSLYTELLNDVRVMFRTYIETKYKEQPERCTPKDLVNLKERYLFVFMIFVMKHLQKDTHKMNRQQLKARYTQAREEQNKILENLKKDLDPDVKSALEKQKAEISCIIYETFNLMRIQDLIKKIDEIENIIGSSNSDFIDTSIGEYFKQGMDDGYLNNFFGADKQQTVDIKQWRDQQVFPLNLTYPTEDTLPGARQKLYNEYKTAVASGEKISPEWLENQSKLNKLSCSPFYYFNRNSSNTGFELPDLLLKTKDGNHISPIIGKSSKNINQKVDGNTIRLQKRSLAGGAAKKMVHTEYLSTDFSFDRDSLDLEINKFEGWRRENFQGCNCQIETNPLKNLPFVNSDGNTVRLEQITEKDYNILLSLKGVCVKMGDNIGKLSILPQHDTSGRGGKGKKKKTYNMKRFKMRLAINRILAPDNRRIKHFEYSEVMSLRVEEEYAKFIDYISTNVYCVSTQGIELVGAGIDDPNDPQPNIPLEYFSIFQNQYTKIEKLNEQGVVSPCVLINTHFDRIHKEKDIKFSHMATYCGMDLFSILTDDTNNEVYIKSFIAEYPYLSKLLYNSLLFDFEPAEALDSPIFYGSRTTGRINWGGEEDRKFVIMKNKTFIQKSIDTARHELKKLQTEVKTGRMTVTYRDKNAPGGEIEIRASSEAPSVSNVLEQYRQTLVLFLFHTQKLSKQLYNAIIADNGKIFKLENRSTKETDESRDLVKKIIDAFNDYKDLPVAQRAQTKTEEKNLLKLMNHRYSIIEFYIQFKNMTVNWEKKNKITITPLPDDSNRANEILAWLQQEKNRYILSSLILSLKTQSDGMQLIVGKALKLIYPIDDKGLETIIHVLTYDHMAAIKGVEKGTPLLLQTERSVIMAFYGKTGDKTYKELLVDKKADSMLEESNITVTIKNINNYRRRRGISNLNDLIKLWYDSKLRPYHYDFGVDKSYIAGKFTQKMIDEITSLTQNYKRTLECIDVLFRKVKNNDNFTINSIPMSKEMGNIMEYNFFGLGGSEDLEGAGNLPKIPVQILPLYEKSVGYANKQRDFLIGFITSARATQGIDMVSMCNQLIDIFIYIRVEAILHTLNQISKTEKFNVFNFELDDQANLPGFGKVSFRIEIDEDQVDEERKQRIRDQADIEPINRMEALNMLTSLRDRYEFTEDEEFKVDIIKDKYLPNLKRFLNFFIEDYRSVLLTTEEESERTYKLVNLQVFLYAKIIVIIIEEIFTLGSNDADKLMIIEYYKIIKILLKQSNIVVTKTTVEKDEQRPQQFPPTTSEARVPSSPGSQMPYIEPETSEDNIIPGHLEVEKKNWGFSKNFYQYVIYRIKRHHNKSEFLINNTTVLDKLISNFHEIVYLNSLVFVNQTDLTNRLIEFFKSKKSKASNLLIGVIEKANARIKALYTKKDFRMIFGVGVDRLVSERRGSVSDALSLPMLPDDGTKSGKRRNKDDKRKRDTTDDPVAELNTALEKVKSLTSELGGAKQEIKGLMTERDIQKAEIKTKNQQIQRQQAQITTMRQEILRLQNMLQQQQQQLQQQAAQLQQQAAQLQQQQGDDNDVDMGGN